MCVDMIYSNYYFKKLLPEHGVPDLSVKQSKKLGNVIHLEGCIEALKPFKALKGQEWFELYCFKFHQKLTLITGNLQPELFFEKLMKDEPI